MNMIVSYIVGNLLRILEFLLFARAILSWLSQAGGSRLYEFLCMLTEPLIQPFRSLVSQIDAFRRCPFDIPFMLAFFTIIVLEQVVYML